MNCFYTVWQNDYAQRMILHDKKLCFVGDRVKMPRQSCWQLTQLAYINWSSCLCEFRAAWGMRRHRALFSFVGHMYHIKRVHLSLRNMKVTKFYYMMYLSWSSVWVHGTLLWVRHYSVPSKMYLPSRPTSHWAQEGEKGISIWVEETNAKTFWHLEVQWPEEVLVLVLILNIVYLGVWVRQDKSW